MELRYGYRVRSNDVVDDVHHGDKLDTSVAASRLTREDGITCMLMFTGLVIGCLSRPGRAGPI